MTRDDRGHDDKARHAAAAPEADPYDESVVTGPTTFPVDRRDFIKLTATGLLLLFSTRALTPEELEAQGRGGQYATDFNAYLHVGADGKVTCLVGKVELGQGPETSFAQVLAEELDVPVASVNVVMGDTDLCPWDGGTYGSMSMRLYAWNQVRMAGAEARAVLLQMASERLQVPVERLNVKGGVVADSADAKKSATYAQLTGGKRIERHLEGKATPKPVKSYTVVGTSLARRDAAAKVTGKAKYAGDIVPPGALHARILRPPAHGAKMTQVDTSAAEKVPGVQVIKDGDMVAVLHPHWDEANKALALVKAQWTRNDPAVDDKTIFDYLVKNAPAPRAGAQGGNLADGEKLVSEIIEHRYEDNYDAHAPMETHSAVAALENGKMTVWAGTQTPYPLKNQVMSALRLTADQVRVITPYVGGGFGGKSGSGQGVEAARLAMLTKKPVRVVWSREEEFFYDTFRPAAVVTIRSGITPAKTIGLWDYTVYWTGTRGTDMFYNIPHHRTSSVGSGFGGGVHLATGAWRAPGNPTNTFARESHIDIMAVKAGMDPVEFRRKNMVDPRMIRVLEAAAKRFGWTPKTAPSGRGVGAACSVDAGSYNCTMVEIAVDKATGRVQVKRVVCMQEMGLVVNPEGALQQMEGCLTMGLGYALSEEVHFKGGDILDRNFDSYQLPLFSWLPRIEAEILPNSDLAPQGGGEPAICGLGAAIANAIFDATGARLYRMSMSPERVKAALAKS